jgi:predicted Zn-dependent protease with MMP-like domain
MAPPNRDEDEVPATPAADAGGDGDAGDDELGALLDRGWELLGANDWDRADISARQALAIEPRSPEALTLVGAVHAARGEEDEALASYRKAMKADPEYVAPLLYCAELLVWPREEYDDALVLIERALERAEDEDDFVDAVLLKAETLLAMEADPREIRDTLEELPPVDFEDGGFHLRAARVWLELDDDVAAEEQYQKALDRLGDDAAQAADIWHGLGLVYELREDRASQVRAWLKVRELDLSTPPPEFTLKDEQFEAVAEETLAELPERIRSLLANVPIVSGDYPSLEIVAAGHDPRMLGFFSGVPYPEKSAVGSPRLLDCVLLYQRYFERVAADLEEVHKEIRITLLHETGHFFGLSEEELEAMGLG